MRVGRFVEPWALVVCRFIVRLVIIAVVAEKQTRLHMPLPRVAALLCAGMAVFTMMFAWLSGDAVSRRDLNHWHEAGALFLLALVFAGLDWPALEPG